MNEVSNESHGLAVGKLRAFIERIERLEEEKKALNEDIKDIYNEMKHDGFDIKATKDIIRLRKQEDHKRQEAEAMLELYKEALGMK